MTDLHPSPHGPAAPGAEVTPLPDALAPTAAPPTRPTWRFLFSHPAHLVALGFGAGLARHAPGTVGTLWAWAAFVAMEPWMTDLRWAVLLLLSTAVGWWACTVTARHMGQPDSGHMVWDEVLGFWLVLWLLAPAGLLTQAAAFGLFRLFDAWKPGPVAWADRHFKGLGPRGGWGVLADDLVAAGCTLLVFALWRF